MLTPGHKNCILKRGICYLSFNCQNVGTVDPKEYNFSRKPVLVRVKAPGPGRGEESPYNPEADLTAESV